MIKRSGFALLLALFFAVQAARAQEATFSPEFEFTNREIEAGDYGKIGQLHISDENLKYQERWAKKMKALCKVRKDCKVEERYDSKYAYEYDGDVYHDYYHPDYRVIFNDGFYFDITLDPAVIEIKVKPGTLEEFRKNKERIQADVFDFAKKELGLRRSAGTSTSATNPPFKGT